MKSKEIESKQERGLLAYAILLQVDTDDNGILSYDTKHNQDEKKILMKALGFPTNRKFDENAVRYKLLHLDDQTIEIATKTLSKYKFSHADWKEHIEILNKAMVYP